MEKRLRAHKKWQIFDNSFNTLFLGKRSKRFSRDFSKATKRKILAALPISTFDFCSRQTECKLEKKMKKKIHKPVRFPPKRTVLYEEFVRGEILMTKRVSIRKTALVYV